MGDRDFEAQMCAVSCGVLLAPSDGLGRRVGSYCAGRGPASAASRVRCV